MERPSINLDALERKLQRKLQQYYFRYLVFYAEIPRKQQTPIIPRNDVQRISDRLQDKLSLLKTHEQKIT